MAICFACGNLEFCRATTCWRCNPQHRMLKTSEPNSSEDSTRRSEPLGLLSDSTLWLYNTHVKPNSLQSATEPKSAAPEEDGHKSSGKGNGLKVVSSLVKMLDGVQFEEEKQGGQIGALVEEIKDKLSELKRELAKLN